MKKSLIIILNLLLILSFASFGYAVEEYVYVTKWTPNGNPRSIATDEDGNVYAAGEQTIMKYTSEGALVFTIQNIPNNDDYNLSSWDMAVAVDSSGYIYVSNEQGHNVVKFDSTGSYVTKWGSQGSDDDQFNEPKGIAISNGYVYVCDRGNYRIVKFDIDGTFISSFGQEGWEDGMFQRPMNIAIDSTNSEIYVTEEWNQRIQVFDLDGIFQRKWATDSSAGDGEATDIRGIAIDSQGNVYVSDEKWMNNKIVKFASDGTFILKWGGYGTDNYHFDGLQGIAIDYSDNVYVVDNQNWDWQNRRILKYRLMGSPTIQITNPTENQFLTGTVTIQATVSVLSGYTISEVEFYLGDNKLGETTSPPNTIENFPYDWDTTASTNGAYTIWVVATNTEETASREKVSIVVANGDAAPTVSITEPTDQEQ
ncbi:MAG: Ig-like domain-containing protein, partial [Calditrichia bacterium]